jgi:hypothetical protein
MDASTPESISPESSGKKSSRGLWLGVALLFVFGALLWAAMFTAARHIDTREVPLASKGARP